MDESKVVKTIYEEFYIPIDLINIDINNFFKFEKGCIKSIKFFLCDENLSKLFYGCAESTFKLVVNSKDVYTDSFTSKFEILDFFIPSFFSVRNSIKLHKDSTCRFIKYELEIVEFSDDYEEKLPHLKIEQVKNFNVEYYTVYNKDSQNIIHPKQLKKYVPVKIIFFDKIMKISIVGN